MFIVFVASNTVCTDMPELTAQHRVCLCVCVNVHSNGKQTSRNSPTSTSLSYVFRRSSESVVRALIGI